MAKKEKQSKTAYTPLTKKSARIGQGAEAIPTMTFRWSLDSFDWDGPFSCGTMAAREFTETVIAHLKAHEGRKWGEVEGSESHFVEIDKIIKVASDRLPTIGMQDTDQLFSLRHGGKPRVWGTRDLAIFRVLWWDPEHAVCPSKKKHT